MFSKQVMTYTSRVGSVVPDSVVSLYHVLPQLPNLLSELWPQLVAFNGALGLEVDDGDVACDPVSRGTPLNAS